MMIKFLQILMYNSLLDFIKEQLTSLENGIKGVIVMPSNLEELFRCIYEAQVPPAWMNVRLHSFWLFITFCEFFEISCNNVQKFNAGYSKTAFKR